MVLRSSRLALEKRLIRIKVGLIRIKKIVKEAAVSDGTFDFLLPHTNFLSWNPRQQVTWTGGDGSVNLVSQNHCTNLLPRHSIFDCPIFFLPQIFNGVVNYIYSPSLFITLAFNLFRIIEISRGPFGHCRGNSLLTVLRADSWACFTFSYPSILFYFRIFNCIFGEKRFMSKFTFLEKLRWWICGSCFRNMIL